MRFSIERSSGQYFVRLKGNNGEIIATTERYVSKQSAQHAIAVIKAEAPAAPTTDNA